MRRNDSILSSFTGGSTPSTLQILSEINMSNYEYGREDFVGSS